MPAQFDLTTMLAAFLRDLQAGTLGVINAISSITLGAGTAAAPSVLVGPAANKDGIYSAGTNDLGFTINGNVTAELASSTFTLDQGAYYRAIGLNGQIATFFQTLTELTTIAAAATTDTTIQMPANALIFAVSVRVTVVIPTAATFTVGDAGSAARFSTAAVTVAAGSTDPGTKAGAYYNAGALAVRITPNGTPGAATGRVRVTIYYLAITPPTS